MLLPPPPTPTSSSPGCPSSLSRGHLLERGFALVIVLAMLVLVLSIVMAYFSKTAQQRQISQTSASSAKTQFLTSTAEAMIVDDLLQEINAGSLADAQANAGVKIYRPIWDTTGNPLHPHAPSAAPQRVGAGSAKNVVKVSRSGVPFFTGGTGYTNNNNGPSRASAISTGTASVSGRLFTKDRWNLPRLIASDELAGFTVPEWIYIDAGGKNPTTFSEAELKVMSQSTPGNADFVIGRYAYVVYDVGGLIDINVVGNALTDDDLNKRKGRLHQVNLADGIGTVDLPAFADFVTWRSEQSSSNASETSGSGGLFDPKRTFLDVVPGEQSLVSRQELLRYSAQFPDRIPADALPLLTTFSRDLNAPSYEPNPQRSKLPASPVADEMNPALLSVRFSSDTTLNRPEGPVEVKAGTPVITRRFPLSKLGLFKDATATPAQFAYYFGLTKQDNHTWRYTATTADGRIARLSEVAAQGREPNFFEILQAVIYTGSLGRANGVDNYTYQRTEDLLQNFQIIQIGANIIDQWDSDDQPTHLEFPSGNANEYLVRRGIENLPYVNQIGLVAWRPTNNRNLFQVWAIFDVWNPHQNAKTPPQGIEEFRIVPLGGRGRIFLDYTVDPPSLASGASSELRSAVSRLYNTAPSNGGCQFALVQDGSNDLVAINAGRNFTFPANGDYSEITTLGGAPSSSTDTPGLLIIQCEPGPAIPPEGSRAGPLQTTIDTIEQESGLTVGVKAHNTIRLRGDAANDWRFALQARYSGDPSGQWRTIQEFEGFVFDQSDRINSPIFPGSFSSIQTNTYHTAPGAPLENEYYVWRSRGASVGMVKIDPRTNRLGLSGWSQASATATGNDFLGRSIRSSPGNLPAAMITDDRGSTTNNNFNWAFPGGIRSVGRSSNAVLSPGFAVIPAFQSPPQVNRIQIGLYAFAVNDPNPPTITNANATNYVARYADPDGSIRPGDAYFGGTPTVDGQFSSRPLMLNRPFRSVAELGHVFRDLPWKSLDFFSRHSADLGLLDVFSITETDAPVPVTAGQINLNTRQNAVLSTVLKNTFKQLPGLNPALPASEIQPNEADALANAIVAESTLRPFVSKGDLITRVLHKEGATDPFSSETAKNRREAAVRSLAEIGTTRTWNFLIDLVTQSGRFTSASKTGADFVIQGEQRIWIHVAIDRMTGEIIDLKKEAINE